MVSAVNSVFVIREHRFPMFTAWSNKICVDARVWACVLALWFLVNRPYWECKNFVIIMSCLWVISMLGMISLCEPCTSMVYYCEGYWKNVWKEMVYSDFVVFLLFSAWFGYFLALSYCFLGVGCVLFRNFVRNRLWFKFLMFPGFLSDGSASGAMFALKELACLIMILCCVY